MDEHEINTQDIQHELARHLNMQSISIQDIHEMEMDDEQMPTRIKKLEQQLNELQCDYEVAMDFIESLGIKGWTDDLEGFAESHPHNNRENEDAVWDITLHISSAAYQTATCTVPISVIRQGSHAVFHHIIDSNETEYSEYDYDDLSNDGLSWEKYSAELNECLSDNKAPSYLWNEPTEEE